MVRGLAALLAGAAGLAALVLAWHHPLWPRSAMVASVLWVALCMWHPRLWLFAVPAGAAFLNASPWTGWTVWDEYDLLLLSTLCGGFAQRALAPPALDPNPVAAPQPLLPALVVAMALAALLSLYRAWADATATAAPGSLAFDWYAGYADPLNSLRVAKSELYALLLLPLLPRNALDGRAAQTVHRPLLAWGMVAGLSVVVLAALWERLAFPGLLQFSYPYRTVALFWEMHVGGEAIDAYLALATPFAAWAVLSARRPWQWLPAALLAMLSGYAVLTTFSRGVYASQACALTLLGLLLLRQRPQMQGWRARAGSVLTLLLVAEVALVLGTGNFMRQRLAETHSDLNSRVQHWQRGLAILRGPGDWLLGRGPGRLPAHYAAAGAAGEFSGSAHWAAGAPMPFVTLSGPATRKPIAGQFALAQRVPAPPDAAQSMQLDVRVNATTDLQLQWCERHLLYDGRCRTAQLRVEPRSSGWQPQVVWLSAAAPAPISAAASASAPPSVAWHAPRLALFTLSVLSAGGSVDVRHVVLPGPDGRNRLANGDFSQGMSHWLGMAQSYFLPWHIDNLFLELLIERGLLGLLLFGLLMACALWRLTFGDARQAVLAPYLAASLTGALCVGLTGSLLDVPRVALLLYVLAWAALLQARWTPKVAPGVRKIKQQIFGPNRLNSQQRMG